MSLMIPTPALVMHGGAVYPYSEALHERLTLESRFDDSFELCTRQGDELWVPRRLAVADAGTVNLIDPGQKIATVNHFTPKHGDQARVVDEMNTLLHAGVSHIVQAPTGYGKTYVGSAAVAAVQRRTLILTTKEDLILQWRDALKNVLGLTDDLIGDWRGDLTPKAHQPVVVALVQSVMKGPARYPSAMFEGFGLVICDEVHRMGADEFTKAMWWLRAKLRLGLSATPYRKDGKEVVFHSHIGDIRVVGEQETLIPKVIMDHMPWKCPRKIVRDEKTKKDRLVRIPHQPGRTMHLMKSLCADVGTNVKIAKFVRLAYEKGRTTIVFSDTMDHLKVLRAYVLKSGVKEADTGWYVGLTADVYNGNEATRRKVRDKAKVARVIFATYKMCSEGTDIPWLDTCVLGSPRGDVNQIVGRIRREHEGKKEPLVYHPVFKDSPVFASYAKSCLEWYKSLGAKVLVYR